MDTSLVTIYANTQSAVININTLEKAIASIATASNVTGTGLLTVYTWWPLLNGGQWLEILSANLTPATLPIRQNMASIFVPGIDLRGETQIMIQFPVIQENDVIFEVKFCKVA